MNESLTDDDDLLDFLDEAGKEPAPLADPGAFHHFGRGLGDSAMSGFARAGRAAAIIAPAVPELFGAGLTPKGKDWYFENVVGATERAVDYWTPDAANVGAAGHIVNGLVQGLVPLATGPVGFIGTTGIDSAAEVVKGGGTVNQALAVGTINATAAAVGYRMPAAWGTTLGTRLATGAGGNVAIDAASRKAAQAALADNPDLAEQYAVTGESTVIAGLFGTVFAGIHHVGAGKAPRGASQAEKDAVLAVSNADHFARATMPGEPRDGAAATAHQGNVESAMRSLLGDQPIDVPHKDLGGMFNVRPDIRAQATGDAYGHMLVALESGGVATAKAPTSSATGLHQFTSATWLRTVRASSPEWATGLTDAQILAQRTNPERSSQMEGVLRAENAAALTNAGQDAADPFNLYAAHHFGSSKGVAFARAAGGTRMDSLLTERQLNANPYLKDMTKAEVMANWSKRARRSGVDVPEQAAVDVLPAELIFPPDTPSRYSALDLRQEIGWSQKGGEIARAPVDPAFLNADEAAGLVAAMPQGEVIGRTRWTGWPSPDGQESVFWKSRPDRGLSEKAANEAMDKFERGDALKPIEQRFIDHANATAKEYEGAMRFMEDSQRGYSEVQRLDGLAALRDQHDVHVLEADHAEAVGVYELAHRAADRGIEPFDIARSSNESEPAYAARLWGLIQEADRANPRATPEISGSGSAGREGGTQRVQGSADASASAGRAADDPGMGSSAGGQLEQGSGRQVAPETSLDAAKQLAANDPEMRVLDSFDADGVPRYRSMNEALAEIDAARMTAERDADAFHAAANCFLRRGGQ